MPPPACAGIEGRRTARGPQRPDPPQAGGSTTNGSSPPTLNSARRRRRGRRSRPAGASILCKTRAKAGSSAFLQNLSGTPDPALRDACERLLDQTAGRRRLRRRSHLGTPPRGNDLSIPRPYKPRPKRDPRINRVLWGGRVLWPGHWALRRPGILGDFLVLGGAPLWVERGPRVLSLLLCGLMGALAVAAWSGDTGAWSWWERARDPHGDAAQEALDTPHQGG